MQRNAKRRWPEIVPLDFSVADMARERSRGVAFDVTSSNGERFGLCVRAEDGRHLYIEPMQMIGLEVRHPMRICDIANTSVLVETLSRALRFELRR